MPRLLLFFFLPQKLVICVCVCVCEGVALTLLLGKTWSQGPSLTRVVKTLQEGERQRGSCSSWKFSEVMEARRMFTKSGKQGLSTTRAHVVISRSLYVLQTVQNESIPEFASF